MTIIPLGRTGLSVSRLCFGTLTISPLQRHLSINDGAALLTKAADAGIIFFDTAELYQNYAYFKHAFEKRDDVVIATKSYSYDKKTAEESLEKSRREMGRDVIDIFLLHEQESDLTIKGHREAIDYFLKQKQKGLIKAFGVSTHHIAGVKAAAQFDEISVIHPIFNLTGIGIADGEKEEMADVLKTAHKLGKGIFSMKPLGGGHLIQLREQALDYVLKQPFIDSVAIGIQNEDELKYNISVFNGEQPSEAIKVATQRQNRHLHIHEDWCVGCGACTVKCQQNAITLKDDKAVVDQDKCTLCSYCAVSCPVLAIKII